MPKVFDRGTKVAKTSGTVHYEGTVLTHYQTTDGHVRYVIQIHPQGFQYIASPDQLEEVNEFSSESGGTSQTSS